MNEITLPVFIIEGEDIWIYSSFEDLKSDLLNEPFLIKDIKEKCYPSYDAKGRLVKIETDGKHINVLPAEEEPMHAAELEALLRKYLIAMKEPMAREMTCDLQCLVQLSLKYTCKVTLREYITELRNKLLGK